MENIKFLFQIYLRPALTMSEILDKGNWLIAAFSVLLVSISFYWTINAKLQFVYSNPSFYEFYNPNSGVPDEDAPENRDAYRKAERNFQNALNERYTIPVIGDYFFKFFSFGQNEFYRPLLSLSVFYVPFVIFLMCIFGGIGNFGLIIRRDYGALAVCSLMAWAAAHLPFSIIGIVLNSAEISPQILFAFWILSSLLFGAFMIFAVRTVFGANYATAILTVCIAWLALSAGMYVFKSVSPWLFSPFLLIYAYMYFGGAISGEVSGAGNAFRQKQNFKRFLHNATVNPNDADAHVQLGLIYLQRRQETKALEHFTKAFKVDAQEIDANYELGKIARRKGELQEALNYFSTVLGQNDKHSLSEIWREIGATYLEANMLDESREALEKFVERRPVDSEGLYYLGKVYKTQNETEKAREMFERAVESAKSSPNYRRRELKRWSKLAQKEL